MTITLVPTLVTLSLLVGLVGTAIAFPGARVVTRLVMVAATIAVPVVGGWLVLGYAGYRRRSAGMARTS